MGVLRVVQVFDSLRGDSIDLLGSVGRISLLKDGKASDYGRCAFGILKLRHDVTCRDLNRHTSKMRFEMNTHRTPQQG